MRAGFALIAIALASAACGGEASTGEVIEAAPLPAADIAPRLLASGEGFTCSVDHGSAVCWGAHPLASTQEPVRVPELGSDVVEIAASEGFLCARDAARDVRCADRAEGGVYAVSSFAGATSIAAGGELLCAIVRGRAVCMRGARGGELASVEGASGVRAFASGVVVLRGPVDAAVVRPQGEGAVVGALEGTGGARDAGGGAAPCVIDADGEVRCAASDALARPAPSSGWALATSVAGAGVVSLLANVGGTRCAIDGEGHARCDVGEPLLEALERLEPRVLALAGSTHVCALRSVGAADSREVLCWGDNAHGQAGTPPARPETPTRVEGIEGASAVLVAGSFACAIDGSSTLRCWDEGDFSALPSAIGAEDGTLVRFDALARWGGGVCAREIGGSVRCIREGRLNQGATRIEGVDASRGLFGDAAGACAIDARREVRCFGPEGVAIAVPALRGADELVVGDSLWARVGTHFAIVDLPTPRGPIPRDALSMPEAPSPLPPRVTRVFGGRMQIFWLTREGALRGAGANGVGELGVAPTRFEPGWQDTDPGEPPLGMSASAHVSCAWGASGALRCAGLDDRLVPRDPRFGGGVGDGSWRVIEGIPEVLSASAGDRVGCALSRGGEIWCWGAGPRGDGRPRLFASPRAVVLPPP